MTGVLPVVHQPLGSVTLQGRGFFLALTCGFMETKWGGTCKH